jgi:hypothetical protein
LSGLTNISKVFTERLQRQINAHPQLHTSSASIDPNSSAQTLMWNDFYRSARGLPFYCQWCSTDKDRCTHGESNCWQHLIGLPVDKSRVEKTLYDYQAYVSGKCGIYIEDKNLLTTFYQKYNLENVSEDIHKPEHELNKNIGIVKATNLGMTELMLRIMCYKATVNDALRNSMMAILVGPNFSLAILILNRIREMFYHKLGLLFEGAQDAIKLNGIRIEAKPSHHIDILRSETNVSFLGLSEACFFPLQDNETILSAILRFRAKSDPWIMLESTPNRPGDLLDRIFNYPDSLEYNTFEKIRLPWIYGWDSGHYNKSLILKQQKTVGWSREYDLQWLGTASNVFTQQSIDAAINKEYDLRGIPAAPKAIGIDPNLSGQDSGFAFTVIQCANDSNGTPKIQVLYSKQFTQNIDFSAMMDHCISLMRQYQNVHNVFIDAAVPVIWQGISRLLNERTDYNNHLKELEQWRYSEQAILRARKCHPVAFGPNHKQMLSNLKYLIDSNTVQINPCFSELIISFRSAQAIEYDLQKTETSYPDLLDSARLALRFVNPKQRIPTMDQLQAEVPTS